MHPQTEQVGCPTDLLQHITTSTTAPRLARAVGLSLPAARTALEQLVQTGELTRRGEEYSRPSRQRSNLLTLAASGGCTLETAAERAVLHALRDHARVGDAPTARDLAISANVTDQEAAAALERLRLRVEVLCVVDRRGLTWRLRNPQETTAADLECLRDWGGL